MLVFMVAQGLYISKHMPPEPSDEPAPAPAPERLP
jgi:hypothetical protein